MRARSLTLRTIVLLAAGSAAVHQLRYAIGYGSAAGHELIAQGHAYLGVALPLVATAAIVTLAAALRRLAARGGPAHASGARRAGLPLLWLASAAALALIYAVQESAEGLLAGGHPGGTAAFIAGSAWLGLALALPAGLLVALGLRGFAAAHAAPAPATPRVPPVVYPSPRPSRRRLAIPARAFLRVLGARGPPLPSVG